MRALTNVNFHCSPAAATVRPDGTYVVEAVTATASFRFGKSMGPWFERSGARVIVGKAGLTELAYREWFVPHGAVYLTTVGYGMGAAYGRGHHPRARRPLASRARHRPGALGARGQPPRARSWWKVTPRAGASSPSPTARSISASPRSTRDLPPPALARFGEILSRTDEVV